MDCKDCLLGYYCKVGVREFVVCLKGIYNFIFGRGLLGECRLCILGMVCFRFGFIWLSVKCDVGYYCFVGLLLLNEIIYVCLVGIYIDYYNFIYVRECIDCLGR